MNAPKISIVIATYNAEKTLAVCLESIFSQVYKNYEILIADGVSTDRTLELIKLHKDRIFAWISEKDIGIYDAWNKIIPRATGDWFLFLGADDSLWDADTLAKAAAHLALSVENVVYGKVAITLTDGSILNFEGKDWERVGKKFRHEMTIPHQGTFHRRALFSNHGLFDPTFRICGDYEFLLRELKSCPARFLPDLTVSRMGFGGVSGTLKNVPQILDELVRAQRQNGIVRPSIYILFRRFRFSFRRALNHCFGVKFSNSIADLYRRMTGKPRLWGRIK